MKAVRVFFKPEEALNFLRIIVCAVMQARSSNRGLRRVRRDFQVSLRSFSR